MTNFSEHIQVAASEHPDHPAIKLDELVLNYQLLDEAVARAAELLRSKGIEEGARVGMQLPNVPYFPVVYFGALRLGAVVVPLNPLLKEREVAYHLSDSEARLILGWHQFADPCAAGAADAGAECVSVKPGEFEQLLASAEPVRETAERSDRAAAVIIYTSGTTGTP